MYITFRDNKIEKICSNKSIANKKVGSDMASVLFKRIGEIRASDNLSVLILLPGPKCHPLHGDRDGQYAVKLVEPKRLIFKPVFEDGPTAEHLITEINIIEIVDYH